VVGAPAVEVVGDPAGLGAPDGGEVEGVEGLVEGLQVGPQLLQEGDDVRGEPEGLRGDAPGGPGARLYGALGVAVQAVLREMVIDEATSGRGVVRGRRRRCRRDEHPLST
jgi:hypothetical protein